MQLLALVLALAACRSVAEEADLAFARDDWDAAADLYAEVLADATESAEIERTKERLGEARERATAAHVERMRVLLAADEIDAALAEGEAALQFAPTEELAAEVAELRRSRDTVAFESGLAVAEAEAAAGRLDAARAAFEDLIQQGFDRERIEFRMRAVIPADYTITLHAAVVLPMKPDVHWPWDGPHKKAIRDSDALLVRLGALAGIEGMVTARLAGAANEFATGAYELPDCYPVVKFDGETWGGARYVREQELHPSWDLRMLVRAAGEDTRVFEFAVFDRDVKDDDTVGTWQIAIGELVRLEGAREFTFVGEDGRLAAGGIVALEFSVERFDR